MNILKEKNIYRKALQVTILLLLGYMVARIWIDPNYIADFEAYLSFWRDAGIHKLSGNQYTGLQYD